MRSRDFILATLLILVPVGAKAADLVVASLVQRGVHDMPLQTREPRAKRALQIQCS
jgi:hypothetical protein